MEFIKKTELFFIQLQYCLTIEPEPFLEGEKGLYSLMLKPDIFLKLINDFQIEYPFIPENKIIELKCLMSKENINTENALKIIENYKKQYWFLDTVTMFEPVIDKLKRTLKSIDINISEKEINIELINYQKYLQAKRESIYIDLINEIKALPPQPIVKQKPIKYGANEYALTYIFDLYAIGQQVPINRIEGSFDAKKIKQDASKFPMYDKAPDTFYRAVKSVLEYDLNKPTDLQNISKDWLNAVRNLSTNWVITEQYLKDKNLIGE